MIRIWHFNDNAINFLFLNIFYKIDLTFPASCQLQLIDINIALPLEPNLPIGKSEHAFQSLYMIHISKLIL